MLRLVFYVGNDRFAVDSSSVVEVIPNVVLSSVSNSPAGIQGMLNFRGELIPVIDFCRLIVGRPASHVLSTRIIIFENKIQSPFKFGIIAEKVTGVIESDEGDKGFATGLTPSPFVERVVNEPGGIINILRISALYDHLLGLVH